MSQSRRCFPYVALEKQLDLYREKCAEHGTTPDIVWIHACHLDEDRDTATARRGTGRSGSSKATARHSSSTRSRPPKACSKADYGFYTAGIMEQLNEVPYEQLIEEDYIWVGTPDDISERIEQTLEICPGIAEVAITVNAGGAPHWMAIKNQELFASRVAPNFGALARAEPAGATA